MPKFAQTWFSGNLFGAKNLVYVSFKHSIHRVPLGFAVRKVFRITNWRKIGGPKDTSRAIIFRVRRGNGYIGSILGKLYQDKYKYFVPRSINNIQSAATRVKFTQAVYNWKNVLTILEKMVYNKRAAKRKGMSGYNKYIQAYVKGDV